MLVTFEFFFRYPRPVSVGFFCSPHLFWVHIPFCHPPLRSFGAAPIHRLALPFAASPSTSSIDAGTTAEQIHLDWMESSRRSTSRVRTNRILSRLRRRHSADHHPGRRPMPGAHRRCRFQQGNLINLKKVLLVSISRCYLVILNVVCLYVHLLMNSLTGLACGR